MILAEKAVKSGPSDYFHCPSLPKSVPPMGLILASYLPELVLPQKWHSFYVCALLHAWIYS